MENLQLSENVEKSTRGKKCPDQVLKTSSSSRRLAALDAARNAVVQPLKSVYHSYLILSPLLYMLFFIL